MPSRQQEFMDRAYWEARSAGLPDPQARLAAAQAALETGYGRSVKGNNYYGIKAGPSWTGPTVNMKTWEEVNGQRVNQRDDFRAYDNPADSFRDWARTIGERWSAAMTAPTFGEAVSALSPGRPGGYATDSRYGQKLGYINEKFDPDPMGIMAAIDPQNIPTPAPRPEMTPAYGIMGAIDPVTPTAVQRGALLDAPIAPNEVTYGGLLGSPPASAFQQNSVSSFAPGAMQNSYQGFDMERFGPQVETPTAPHSVLDRMGPVQPVAQGLGGLQRGLLDQQLDAGILPEIPAPMVDPAPVAAVPGYVDPRVSVQAPAIEEYPAAPAPVSVQPAQPAMSAAQQTFNQRSALGAPVPSALGPQMARDVQKQMAMRNTLGMVGGALLGGAILGPLGGLLGGAIGKNVSQKSYHPPAPEPVAGQPRSERGGVSYGDLNSYGRDAYDKSKDFKSAVDKGGVGLY